MEPFDWKRKFDASFTCIDSSGGFDCYHLENETGEGAVTACTVFPGLQAIIMDLHMSRCNNLLKTDRNIIEILYCLDGRFESNVSKRYCHIVSAGNFAVSYAGKRESHGEFPTGRYQGTDIFLDAKLFLQHHPDVRQELDFHIRRIQSLAASAPHFFYLRHFPELVKIQTTIVAGFKAKSVLRLRLGVMDLLMCLGNLDVATTNDTPVYLNNSLVNLIESAQKLLTADLSRHLTIDNLAAQLGMGTTVLKTAFKSVYGIPIYQYLKDLRLQEAQRLLRETTLPVSAIAAKVGYANPAKFSSAFKKRFGVSPTEYKRNAISSAIRFPVAITP